MRKPEKLTTSHARSRFVTVPYPQADGSVLVDGAVALRDLNRTMDWNLPEREATTIAGLLIHDAATIPEPGQIFVFHGFRFAVIGKTRNRITAVKVTPAG